MPVRLRERQAPGPGTGRRIDLGARERRAGFRSKASAQESRWSVGGCSSPAEGMGWLVVRVGIIEDRERILDHGPTRSGGRGGRGHLQRTIEREGVRSRGGGGRGKGSGRGRWTGRSRDQARQRQDGAASAVGVRSGGGRRRGRRRRCCGRGGRCCGSRHIRGRRQVGEPALLGRGRSRGHQGQEQECRREHSTAPPGNSADHRSH